MSTSRSWLNCARRALASHVDRLQATLGVLTERLGATVAQAVSNTLARMPIDHTPRSLPCLPG